MRRILPEWRIGSFLGFGAGSPHRCIGSWFARKTRDVRTIFPAQIVACNERLDHIVEAEEERLAKRKSGRHVQSIDGEEIAQLDLVRILIGVVIQAGGISFEQGARIGRHCRIVPFCSPARVEQVINIVYRCPVLPRNRAISATSHGDDILKRGEIILRMRNGHPIGDIAIPLAVDMRHAKFVTDNLGRIVCFWREGVAAFRPKRLPRSQRDECHEHHQQQHRTGAPEPFRHQFNPLLTECLASGAGRRNALGKTRRRAFRQSDSGR